MNRELEGANAKTRPNVRGELSRGTTLVCLAASWDYNGVTVCAPRAPPSKWTSCKLTD